MKLDPRKVRAAHGYALILNLTVVPIARFESSPGWGKALAGVVAVLQVMFTPETVVAGIAGDIFSGIFVLSAVATIADWWNGRTLARARKDYDPEVARWGLQSKLASLAILLLVRGFEYWLGNAGVLDTRGFVAAALSTALFAEELRSIHVARVRAGARPMPLLGRVLAWVDQIGEGMVPDLPDNPHQKRREEDREITDRFRALRGVPIKGEKPDPDNGGTS